MDGEEVFWLLITALDWIELLVWGVALRAC